MLRRTRNLERITLHLSDSDILTHLVSDPASPSAPFTWPNLRHLELRATCINFWSVAETSDLFARFLVAHPLLETLILHNYNNSQEYKLSGSFSLARYPHALRNLQVLRAPLCIIAGVLESTSAASSLTEITDSTILRIPRLDSEQLLKRVISLFECVPNPPIHRLKIQVPRFAYELFMRLSKCMPNLKTVEFDDEISVDPRQQGAQEESSVMVSSSSLLTRCYLFKQMF